MDVETIQTELNAILEKLHEKTFIFDLLACYALPQASITRLKKGDYNLSKNKDEVLWKKKLLYKVEGSKDLHVCIDQLKNSSEAMRHQPRFIIVTDFSTLLSVDTKTDDTLDIPLVDLAQHFDFFLPWSGMEKTRIQSLNLADVKAAEKLAQLYDIIVQENHIQNDNERHGLNIFLSRLLFCFFAEDTGIFDDDQFTNAIASHTHKDGSDLQDYLIALFKMLNTKNRSNEPAYLKAFPYVNGGLFEVDYPAPKLNAKARKIIINAGTLNWKQINPDIFGSMMQAVVHSDQRGSLGMHYTSVANIMKVIEPLFLNDLRDALEKAEGEERKLIKLLDRLYHLCLFDPACGSGNFLIIAYKELCKLEIEIYRKLQKINLHNWKTAKSGLRLSQFYGIELDDFAQETTKLSLWLAEHQMNLSFKEVFGITKPTLPLQDSGHIVCGNATRLDWGEICPKDQGAEIYVLGNPPYLGGKKLSRKHKKDMAAAGIGKFLRLDYISCWFVLASKFIKGKTAKFAFVSTKSICQGEQVHLLWPKLLYEGIEINFAYTSFTWSNGAKGNAGVTCIILGLENIDANKLKPKFIITDGIVRHVRKISPYLIEGDSILIEPSSSPLNGLPPMCMGSNPVDGKNLVIEKSEYDNLVRVADPSIKYIKRYMGGGDFLYGKFRYCLWINDNEVENAIKNRFIYNRIEKCRTYRENAGRDAKKVANVPHRFCYRKHKNTNAIIFPKTTTEKREYVPCGYSDQNTIINVDAFAIYEAEPYIFSLLSSKLHMTWLSITSGRLRTGHRYSVKLSYNTFPFPDIGETQKATLEEHAFKVLDEREQHSEKTMAELYDPDKMPKSLRQAHHEMDLAIEQCYRKKPFRSNEERLEYLFRLYEEIIEAEKQAC